MIAGKWHRSVRIAGEALKEEGEFFVLVYGYWLNIDGQITVTTVTDWSLSICCFSTTMETSSSSLISFCFLQTVDSLGFEHK